MHDDNDLKESLEHNKTNKPSKRRIKDLLCSPIGINDDEPFEANEEEKQLLDDDDDLLLVGSNESDMFLLHEKTPPLGDFESMSE